MGEGEMHCKGGLALGTYCGKCDKCIREMKSVAYVVDDLGKEYSSANGGTSLPEIQAEAFLAGLSGRLPNDWGQYIGKGLKRLDPEFAEYERLRAKFR